MKIVMIRAARIQELDKTDDETGAITVRGMGAFGQTVDVKPEVAKELINMKKAVMPDSEEAKQAIKTAEKLKKEEKAADK